MICVGATIMPFGHVIVHRFVWSLSFTRGVLAWCAGEQPTVKYLSSSQLMGLQLQDADFRRHFLLQAAVFLHSCQHPQSGKAARLEALKPKQVRHMCQAILCVVSKTIRLWSCQLTALFCQRCYHAHSAHHVLTAAGRIASSRLELTRTCTAVSAMRPGEVMCR